MSRGRLSLISCESGKYFANRVAKHLEKLVGERTHYRIQSTEIVFPNGEIKVVIDENIRGDDVYIIQCVDDPLMPERSINDNIFALLTAINAAYQADADRVTAVIPQFPYSRQERKKGREAITAKQIAHFLEISGADRVITLDIHSEAIEGFFTKAKLENLHASRTLIDHLKKSNYLVENLVVVAPDVGGSEKARFYSKELKTDFAIVDKARDYSKIGKIESMRLVGNVKDKNILIVDDIIATGGTLINAANLLKSEGALDIIILCSLPYFNGNAIEKLRKAYNEGVIKKIIGTDAVFHGEKFLNENEWYEEVSIAELFANVIYNINTKKSVSKLLK